MVEKHLQTLLMSGKAYHCGIREFQAVSLMGVTCQRYSNIESTDFRPLILLRTL